MRGTHQRLLLTGASGLFGRSLRPALADAGYEVVPVSRSEGSDPELRRCDLADPEACRHLLLEVQPDHVVHCAGGAAGDRNDLYRANVLTTVHLLEGSLGLSSPPSFVLFGSAAEYGAQEGVLGEEAPLHPVTEYGRAKVAQTALAVAIAAREGIAWTLLRPFNVVAPDLPSGVALGNLRAQLLAPVPEPRPLRCGRLDVVRDFIPLAAVAEAVLALLRLPTPLPPGTTINLASGVGLTLQSILDAMAARAGVAVAVEIDAALAALPAVPSVIGDPGRMRELLGLEIAVSPESLAAILVP